MKPHRIILALLASVLLGSALPAQTAPATSWPTYNGDYSGRRFSPLKDINDANVSSLAVAWTYKIDLGGRSQRIEATPLEINGILYFTVPNHVRAVDARTGKQIWQFDWKSKGGLLIGNRGVAVDGASVYFESPDCNLVALNIKDGTELWHSSICDMDQMYYSSTAPVVVKNHVIVGVSGDDLDIPGYTEALDPQTGKMQWRWYTHPNPGDPEAKSWPNTEAMMHGGGMVWVPGTYDPTLNLYYFGTGNAQPVTNGRDRPGANLYTGCIIAINPDTGKMKWYFQPNPHDTHDWDAVQTPVLFDGVISGKPRKLLAQASRNGWFFVVDRTNGKAIVSAPYAKTDWALGVGANGSPIPNPDKMPQENGALVEPNQGGASNWPPPSFDPQTGLFYTDATDAYSIYYIFDDSPKPEGWAGNDRGGFSRTIVKALDYKTGKPRWAHPWPNNASGRSGILSTAGNLVFLGDPSGNLVAFNAATGDIVWHASLGGDLSNGPMTYELDGRQYLVVAANGGLSAFTRH